MNKRPKTIEVCSICRWPVRGPKDAVTCLGHTQMRAVTREIVKADFGETRAKIREVEDQYGKIQARDMHQR